METESSQFLLEPIWGSHFVINSARVGKNTGMLPSAVLCSQVWLWVGPEETPPWKKPVTKCWGRSLSKVRRGGTFIFFFFVTAMLEVSILGPLKLSDI